MYLCVVTTLVHHPGTLLRLLKHETCWAEIYFILCGSLSCSWHVASVSSIVRNFWVKISFVQRGSFAGVRVPSLIWGSQVSLCCGVTRGYQSNLLQDTLQPFCDRSRGMMLTGCTIFYCYVLLVLLVEAFVCSIFRTAKPLHSQCPTFCHSCALSLCRSLVESISMSHHQNDCCRWAEVWDLQHPYTQGS